MKRTHLLLLFPLVATSTLHSQAPEIDARLGVWEDSLEQVSTLAEIESLDAVSRAGSGVESELRRAFYIVRKGELRDSRTDLDEALFNMAQSAAREGDWYWPRYGLSRALVALERREFVPKPGSGLVSGESNARGVWRALKEAAERNPDFTRSRDLLLELGIAAADRLPVHDFEQAFHHYLEPEHIDWRALQIEGRNERASGDQKDALTLLDSALALGGDPSVLQLDRARTLHAMGETPRAADAYWQSLDSLSEYGRQAHMLDLAWITAADTVQEFGRLPADSAQQWMRRFWARRDVENVRAPGERLMEHLRRWNHVRDNYRIPATVRRTEMKRTEFDMAIRGQCFPAGAWSLDDLIEREPSHPYDIRSDERMMDHRAIIYMRHGEPIHRSITGGGTSDLPPTGDAVAVFEAAVTGFTPSGNEETLAEEFELALDSMRIFRRNLTAEQRTDERVRQNESWLYWVDGRYRVLHFTGSQALGLHAPTTLNTILPLRPDLYLGRGNLFGSYLNVARMLLTEPRSTPHACQDVIQEMMQASRDDAAVAATEDSYTPVFDSTFMLYTQFHGLGVGEGSSGRALVVFAIPSVGLVPSSTLADGRKLVPIRFRLNFFDQVSGESRFVDTTRTFAVRSLELDTFLSGHFEVPLGQGQWTMGLKAEQQAAGTGGMSRHRRIDVASQTGLRLGDIVLGRPGAMPIWNSGAGPINLNPLNTWLSGGDLEIWFELAGLSGGTEFRTRLEVMPQARGKRGVTVELTDRATEGVTSLRRTLELRDLEEGAYTLRVTVTAGGQSASRERPIQVVERD